MTNPTLQAELEQILEVLCDTGCRINGDIADGFGDYHTCEIPEALQAILATVSKHLPEKQLTEIIDDSNSKAETHDKSVWNYGVVRFNTAITEMEKTLGADNG